MWFQPHGAYILMREYTVTSKQIIDKICRFLIYQEGNKLNVVVDDIWMGRSYKIVKKGLSENDFYDRAKTKDPCKE